MGGAFARAALVAAHHAALAGARFHCAAARGWRSPAAWRSRGTYSQLLYGVRTGVGGGPCSVHAGPGGAGGGAIREGKAGGAAGWAGLVGSVPGRVVWDSASESWKGLTPVALQAWDSASSWAGGHGWRQRAHVGGRRRARVRARHARWYGCAQPGQRARLRRPGAWGKIGSRHVGHWGRAATLSSLLLPGTAMAAAEWRAWAEMGCGSPLPVGTLSACCRGALRRRRSCSEDAMGEAAAQGSCDVSFFVLFFLVFVFLYHCVLFFFVF